MSFNIYSITDTDAADAVEQLTDDDLIETGLSSGEFRQALLDRFRQELKTEDVYFINLSLEPFQLEFESDLVETSEGRQSILSDLESFLYDIEDEDLFNTFWEFHNETIYARSDE